MSLALEIKQIREKVENFFDGMWDLVMQDHEIHLLQFTVEWLIDRFGEDKVKQIVDRRVKNGK